ncbi:uncharacterized protein LOC105279839 isoform X2 [Ooceraea biroi]|uniref:uncharacterized protein LOC105279839 isoform X2 n=1 Tax=Ooceraea biroi TaxID=2015173 RepID=UPI000F0976FA|nr:uncharacterized protein LOC105279839 isoform X2 [Ooceraea biroi]
MQNADDNRNRDVSEIAEEAHREIQSPRGILRYPSVLAHGSTSKSKYDGKVSVTPQKRQTHPQVETPTKRRRLSFEDVIPVPLEDVVAQLSATAEPSVPLEDVTVPQILVEGTVASASPLPEE